MGLLMDMSPAYHGGIVGGYIKQIKDEGFIIVLLIEDGFKCILTVCDFSANKQLKALVKDG